MLLLQVRLSTAPPANKDELWQCQIKLRKECDPVTGLRDVQPREEVFAVLSHKQRDALPFFISAAQKALLNPTAPAKRYCRMAEQDAAEADAAVAAAAGSSGGKDKAGGAVAPTAMASAAEEDERPFTKNVVVLEVAGASVDLTLIDLPGIIQTEQGGERSQQ